MNLISPQDVHHIRAAIGWLELGNCDEANAELDQIEACSEQHPDVLKVRWMILSEARMWDAAVLVSKTLIEVSPGCPNVWIFHAYATRRTAGIQAAWDLLSPAGRRFPNEPTLTYALACFAAQLGKHKDSILLLRRALDLGGKQLKSQALQDPDLEPIREEINSIEVASFSV